MKALSDAKSLILFQTIAASSPEGLRTSKLNDNLQISPKQLYTRISSLMIAVLVSRQGGRHLLTSYGEVILSSLDIMNEASAYYQKLVAIDIIEGSDIANNMPEEERREVVEILISNQQIRNVLLHCEVIK